MKEPSAEIFLKRLVVDLKSEWADMVQVASTMKIDTPYTWPLPEATAISSICDLLEKETGTGRESLERKLTVILHYLAAGHTPEEIIAWGQKKTLGDYGRTKRAEQQEQQVQLRFSMPGKLRDLVIEQIERIRNVADLKTSEELWTFLHSFFLQWPDRDILHHAGEATKAAHLKARD